MYFKFVLYDSAFQPVVRVPLEVRGRSFGGTRGYWIIFIITIIYFIIYFKHVNCIIQVILNIFKLKEHKTSRPKSHCIVRIQIQIFKIT
jgi:hypothetical protein